ncbi:MAG: response regulator [Pirellulaceae bacterium]
MMSDTIRISICDPNERSRENLKKYLVGMDRVWLEADCSRYEFFMEIVEQTSPNAVIIDLDEDEIKALQLIASVKSSNPGCGVIAVSSRSDGQLILKAMRSGAGEFVNSPVQIDELMLAMERVTQATTGMGRAKSGATISITGASGGVGCTSVAVNLACAIARNPENNVVLVDLDLSLGDADVFLDTIPDYTLLDVAENISRLDLAMLRKSLTKHDSGVYLLPRPIHLEDMNSISTEEFRRVMGLLKASFSHLVIDLSKSFNRLDMVAMQMSDHILMLTQLDLPCLRNVVRILTSLENHEGVSDKVKIVVNRAGLDKSQISYTNAEETINREVFWKIPNNYSVIAECRNNGVPLLTSAPRASITASINELADKLCNVSTAAESTENVAGDKKEKKGWLNFLSK